MTIASIRDAKSEVWLTPLFFNSPGQAERSFGDAVNDGKSEFWKHPEDYTLFVLGTFDPQDGSLEVLAQPYALTLAVNVKESNE